MRNAFSNLRRLVSSHPKLTVSLVLAGLLVPVGAIVAAYAVIEPSRAYVLPTASVAKIADKHIAVGIVFGAGVTKDGKPYRELQSRLDVAADALSKGYVSKLVLSGDNRFQGYNEPKAMVDYLVQRRGIDATKLQPDYAGRSTYETCERASKVFGLHQAVLFSAESHLPRAIYLCRNFGVETCGVASSVEANNAGRREAVARVKALYNVYINGERTVLGAHIKL